MFQSTTMMRAAGEQGDRRTPSAPKRLGCAETWAGNGRAASLVELPGLTAWVHSLPAGPDRAGGDVHYVSLCPSCIVSRVALADVSGHGETVAVLGQRLRELMERHLRAVQQIALMRDLNRAVRDEVGQGHYATMVALGWHRQRGLAVLTNAGHPPPLLYRASCGEWSWLESPPAVGKEGPNDVPLGLLPDVVYDRLVLKPQPRDVIVLYSDGVSEAASPSGNELGRDGLMSVARALSSHSAEAVGAQLASALRAFRGEAEPIDDETIIVIEVNGS